MFRMFDSFVNASIAMPNSKRSWLWVGCLLWISSGLWLGCGVTPTQNQNQNNQNNQERKFKDLTHDEKLVFMGTKVFGTLKGLFQTHNATRYASFACETCHGQNNNQYKMPSGIFPMDPANPLKDDDATYGKTVVFMKQQILPKMKELLQDDTLTCFTCHGKK